MPEISQLVAEWGLVEGLGAGKPHRIIIGFWEHFRTERERPAGEEGGSFVAK